MLTQRVRQKSGLGFFRFSSGFHDNGEGISFQRSTANQRAIDVWLSEQFCRVSCVYRAAVLDDHLFSDFSILFSHVVTDEFVNRLSLSWSCRFAGTDSPNWLISDNRAFEGFSTQRV